MPSGIAPAPEIFPIKLNTAIEGIYLVVLPVVDDILIVGEGAASYEEALADHERKLLQLLTG